MKCPECGKKDAIRVTSTYDEDYEGTLDLTDEDPSETSDNECRGEAAGFCWMTIAPDSDTTCYGEDDDGNECGHSGLALDFAEPKDMRWIRPMYQATTEDRLVALVQKDQLSEAEHAEIELLKMLVNLWGRTPYITDPTTGQILTD